MIEITWKIETLERRSSDGFVTVAHWRATAVDGIHSATIYNTASWNEGDLLIPYEELTEQQVLEWCWESGGVDKQGVENSLSSQVELQKSPSTMTGVPWAGQPAEPQPSE